MWPCATCEDDTLNGDEDDIDCGGSCDPCVLPPEPEQDDEYDDSNDPTADDSYNEPLEQENGTAFFHGVHYNSQTGAGPMPGYDAESGAPYYPWLQTSIVY